MSNGLIVVKIGNNRRFLGELQNKSANELFCAKQALTSQVPAVNIRPVHTIPL